jgi:hypothetical protein
LLKGEFMLTLLAEQRECLWDDALLIHNEQAVPAELPSGVAAWLEATNRLPDWVHAVAMEPGSRLVVHNGPRFALPHAAQSPERDRTRGILRRGARSTKLL